MSKIVKMVNWTSPNGAAIEVKIEISKSVEKDISYSDGWNVDLGDKVVEFKKITVYVNDKYFEDTYNNPSVVTGICYSPDYIKKVKAGGGYAKLTDKVIINEEKYNLIMAEITAAETEVEAEFKAENTETVAEIEKAEKVEAEKEIAVEKEWATKIMAEIKTRETGILSAEDEKQWRINYNNINNEGGEGYIPHRATLEDVARAKEILGGM